eukprot:gene142-7520_t
MLAWGVVTMSVFGLRHDECEGLAISDIRAPAGAAWQLRVLPASGRTKTGVPGVAQMVPLPRLLFGMPYVDLLHRGAGALAAASADGERWRRPVPTARFMFWLVARSLLRWRSDGRQWAERLKRHNALGSFLADYAAELRGLRLFPAWEKSVCRAVVSSLAAPCGWATEEAETGKQFGYAVHGGRSAMATLLYCAYDTPAPVIADMARWSGKAAGGYIHPRHPAIVEAVRRASGARAAGLAPHLMPADPGQGWANYQPRFDCQREPRWAQSDSPAALAIVAAALGQNWRGRR